MIALRNAPIDTSIVKLDQNALNNYMANQQAAAIANVIKSNAGVQNVSVNTIQGVKIPTSISVAVTSNPGAGAVTSVINLFNSSIFGNQTETNGSGPGSITYNWGDGTHDGALYTELFRSQAGSNGLKIFGFNIKSLTNGGSLPYPSGFTTAELAVLLNDLKGRTIPFEVTIDEAERNTQYNQGLLTLEQPMMLNTLMQLQYSQDPSTTMVWTFFTDASSFAKARM